MTTGAADVTVVIPTYNRLARVQRALESVLAQDHPARIIVVDDGSTDGTADALEARALPGVRVLRSPNLGAAAARNLGAAHATTPWLTFLDSDDLAKPGWLRAMMAAARTSGADIVCCGLERGPESGDGPMERFLPAPMGPQHSGCTGRFTNGGVFLLRTELFRSIGGYDEQLACGQHTELALRLLGPLNRNIPVVHSVPEILIRVIIHDGPRIRTNAPGLLAGRERTLWKHAWLQHVAPSYWASLHRSAGSIAARSGQIARARSHFLAAAVAEPHPRNAGRLAMSYLPFNAWGTRGVGALADRLGLG